MKLINDVLSPHFAKVKAKILGLHKKIQPFYLILALITLSSHDLYLKMETYLLEPHQEAILSLYNGTFEKSENIITRDRMIDASIVGQGERLAIKPEEWTDKDSIITRLSFNTGDEGTYVAGVSTKPRNIELSADKFNDYLVHDGVLDILALRKLDGLLEQDAVESYQKHVKAIYQVGGAKTDDWNTVLGYPIEFVPQANPYEKKKGDELTVQLLLDGKPLANQLVYADFLPSVHSHGHEESAHGHSHADGGHSHSHSADEGNEHTHTGGQKLRSDEQGLFTVELSEDGIYFLRSIYMTTVSDDDELTHRSKWATLTFEVGHKHGPGTHTHHGIAGVPVWVLGLGSLLIIVLLILVFRKRK